MANIVKFENPEVRPSWLPAGATLVRAAGEPCDISLDDEYQPSPERLKRFMDDLKSLDEAQRRSAIEDRNLRF